MQTRRTFLGLLLSALPAWLLKPRKTPNPSPLCEGQSVEWGEYYLDQDTRRVPFVQFEREVSIEEAKRMFPPAALGPAADSGAALYMRTHRRKI